MPGIAGGASALEGPEMPLTISMCPQNSAHRNAPVSSLSWCSSLLEACLDRIEHVVG